MIRIGLRGEILFAFALVTLFAIGLNTLVILQLDGLLVGRERLEESRSTARLAALSLGAQPTEAELGRLLTLAPDIISVQSTDPQGAPRGAAGAPAPASVSDAMIKGATLLGETHAEVEGLLADGGQLIEAVTPLGPSAHPAGALVLWRRAGSSGPFAGRARALTFLYVALDALLAGGLGWYLIARAVVGPLRRVADATRRVAEGDLGVRVPAASSNELGDLARDFNRMTTALSEKEALLAKQVEELRRANASLQSAREEVVQSEKLASVGRLAAGVAHELGNPVGAVIGYVSLLQRGKLPAEDADVLTRIEREMKRIDRIIRDLLDFARPRQEAAESFDLEATVDAALAIVSVQGAFKSIEVERRRAGAATVKGDAHRLQQVVVNLLINAADAMESSPTKKVVVETKLGEFPAPPFARRREDAGLTGPALVLRVSDSGPGISAAHLPLLFEPFFTTKEPGRGTGLGLAISRTIVESMGGRILVESPPGEGATFAVLLPPS